MKSFFIHYNNHAHRAYYGTMPMKRQPARGFTAYIQDGPEPNTIKVSAGLCAPGDNFCRKTGREEAMKAPSMEINKRDLPDLLARLRILSLTKRERQEMLDSYPDEGTCIKSRAREYHYVYRYML